MGNALHIRQVDRRPVMVRRGLVLVMVWLLAGCGASARKDLDLNTQQAGDKERQEELAKLFNAVGDDWVYQIQPGDKLEVVFFTHPEQNRFVSVRPDGRITMPYVGEINAEGRPPTDLAADIQSRYETVLIKPRVDVIVQELSAPIYVLGEVNHPGEVQFNHKLDVLQAVAAAGGFNDEARLTSFVVLRRDSEGKGAVAIFDFRAFMSQPDGPANIELRPYDVVWVPKNALTRWNDAAENLFRGVISAQDVALKAWTLIKFDDVYARGVRP